jgi:GNAT superfamily N-acetyltransferase
MINPKPHAAPAAPSLAVERPQDVAGADALIERAFGPGRLTKVSERVREFARYAPELSFCARRDGRVVGVVRQWRVRCGATPVVFLGPIAVDAEERSSGLGGKLVAAAVEAAKAAVEGQSGWGRRIARMGTMLAACARSRWRRRVRGPARSSSATASRATPRPW